MIQGSCLCSRIQYQLEGPLMLINNCHCSMCRKAGGAAYGTFAHASSKGFNWLCGKELIHSYASSENNQRSFCSVCGSNMPVIEEKDSHVIIPAGTLDTDPGIKPCVHIFVGSKAPWHDITDQLEQFDQFPPPEWYEQMIAKHSGADQNP